LTQHGDESEGFTIDNGGDFVLVTARGFWSAETADKMAESVLTALAGRRQPLIFELSELRPLRDEGQLAFKALFKRALARGTPRIVVRSASAMTKLQMMRIARETGQEQLIRVE